MNAAWCTHTGQVTPRVRVATMNKRSDQRDVHRFASAVLVEALMRPYRGVLGVRLVSHVLRCFQLQSRSGTSGHSRHVQPFSHRFGKVSLTLTHWYRSAVDLVCISCKVSQRFYGSLKVHEQRGQERLPAVQRLDGLRREGGKCWRKVSEKPCRISCFSL